MILEIWNKGEFVKALEPEPKKGNNYYFCDITGDFYFTRLELWENPDKKIAVYEERYTNGRSRELRHKGTNRYALSTTSGKKEEQPERVCIKCKNKKPIDEFMISNKKLNTYRRACVECETKAVKSLEDKCCKRCGHTLPISEFYFNKSLNRYKTCCKTCQAEINRTSYKKRYWEKKKDRATYS